MHISTYQVRKFEKCKDIPTKNITEASQPAALSEDGRPADDRRKVANGIICINKQDNEYEKPI